jgi:hypothetical protein
MLNTQFLQIFLTNPSKLRIYLYAKWGIFLCEVKLSVFMIYVYINVYTRLFGKYHECAKHAFGLNYSTI